MLSHMILLQRHSTLEGRLTFTFLFTGGNSREVKYHQEERFEPGFFDSVQLLYPDAGSQ